MSGAPCVGVSLPGGHDGACVVGLATAAPDSGRDHSFRCTCAQNFAMMGIATGPNNKGVLTVTDDDTIEKSNLSRQFLFRDWNIGRCERRIAGACNLCSPPSPLQPPSPVPVLSNSRR